MPPHLPPCGVATTHLVATLRGAAADPTEGKRQEEEYERQDEEAERRDRQREILLERMNQLRVETDEAISQKLVELAEQRQAAIAALNTEHDRILEEEVAHLPATEALEGEKVQRSLDTLQERTFLYQLKPRQVPRTKENPPSDPASTTTPPPPRRPARGPH